MSLYQLDEDPLVEAAREFAYQRHSGQKRKYTGDPYFIHCAAVAYAVAQKTDDAEVIAAAFLHDTIEDTNTSFLELEQEFGERVACLVLELTDQYPKKLFPHLSRKFRKLLEAQRLGQISDDAKLIKLADMADNTQDIVEHDKKFAITYLREKADVLEAMGFGR